MNAYTIQLNAYTIQFSLFPHKNRVRQVFNLALQPFLLAGDLTHCKQAISLAPLPGIKKRIIMKFQKKYHKSKEPVKEIRGTFSVTVRDRNPGIYPLASKPPWDLGVAFRAPAFPYPVFKDVKYVSLDEE
jgi:hypothetical protein